MTRIKSKEVSVIEEGYRSETLHAREKKGTTQRVAAARIGMSERTARKYEQAGKVPSQLKGSHDWNTRQNPFEEDWPWVVEQLTREAVGKAPTITALVSIAQSRECPLRHNRRVCLSVSAI